MEQTAKQRKPMSKKKITLLAALGLSVLLICLTPLLRYCGVFTDDALDPIRNTSYSVHYKMYTNDSGHGGETPYYCVTDDGYFLVPSHPATYIKLSQAELDAESFYAMFDRKASIPSHWQGELDGQEFGPEYIYKRLTRVWYGENQRKENTGFVYILELNSGMWLIAQGWDQDGLPTIYFVNEVKPAGSQDAFFDCWEDILSPKAWEFIYLKYGHIMK